MSRKNSKNTKSSKTLAAHPAMAALGAALSFGASAPAAKLLVGHTQAQLLAGLLYLGSGLGLSALLLLSRLFSRRTEAKTPKHAGLNPENFFWLAGAIIFGGILGPVLFMKGLDGSTASTASLLLNLESVFTAVLAWFAFRENFDRRLVLGMMAIFLGSLFLAWQPGSPVSVSPASLFVAGACLCWALDNNLTRNISHCDPVLLAAIKGLVSGLINTMAALSCGSALPGIHTIAGAFLIGFFGYGWSLVLFIRSLNELGTARSSAYFATAPFAGALLSVLFLQEKPSMALLAAAALMALGVHLHLSEKHEHEHSHPEQEHEHWHYHDEHHQHEHGSGVSTEEPHCHFHRHEALSHTHPHYPDADHRHDH